MTHYICLPLPLIPAGKSTAAVITLLEFNELLPSSDASAITLSSEHLQVFVTSVQGQGGIATAWRSSVCVDGPLQIPSPSS